MQTCPHCEEQVPSGSQFCQDCGSKLGATAKAKRPTARGAHEARSAAPKRSLLAGLLAVVLVVGTVMTWLQLSKGAADQIPVNVRAATHIGHMQMPGWLQVADPAVKHEYMWAAENWEVLQFMPCYCGCHMDPFDHRTNFACYFKHDEQGNITGFDDHGYG